MPRPDVTKAVRAAVEAAAKRFQKAPYTMLFEADLRSWIHTELLRYFKENVGVEVETTPSNHKHLDGLPNLGHRVHTEAAVSQGGRKKIIDVVVCGSGTMELTGKSKVAAYIAPCHIKAAIEIKLGTVPHGYSRWLLGEGLVHDIKKLSELEFKPPVLKLAIGFDRSGTPLDKAEDYLKEHIKDLELEGVTWVYLSALREAPRGVKFRRY